MCSVVATHLVWCVVVCTRSQFHFLTVSCHIKTAEQWTIIQLVPLAVVGTARMGVARPTSYYLKWQYNSALWRVNSHHYCNNYYFCHLLAGFFLCWQQWGWASRCLENGVTGFLTHNHQHQSTDREYCGVLVLHLLLLLLNIVVHCLL